MCGWCLWATTSCTSACPLTTYTHAHPRAPPVVCLCCSLQCCGAAGASSGCLTMAGVRTHTGMAPLPHGLRPEHLSPRLSQVPRNILSLSFPAPTQLSHTACPNPLPHSLACMQRPADSVVCGPGNGLAVSPRLGLIVTSNAVEGTLSVYVGADCVSLPPHTHTLHYPHTTHNCRLFFIFLIFHCCSLWFCEGRNGAVRKPLFAFVPPVALFQHRIVFVCS